MSAAQRSSAADSIQIVEESAAPVVPAPGTYPAGFAPLPSAVSNGAAKIWTVGTLKYTAVGLVILFSWMLLGDFAIALRDRSVGPVVQLMLQGFQANNFTIAVLMTVIPTAIAMVLGPIVSYRSDRYRSRWGRRIPFLLIPTPFAVASMIGMAFCPQLAGGIEHLSGGEISHKAALLGTFATFWTLFEIAVVTASSVFSGLINDVVPRAVVGRFLSLWRAVSLIDGMIFNWFIIGHAEEHFTAIFVWIALVFGVGFTLMCLMVKEGAHPAPVDNPNDLRAKGFFGAVKVYLQECFSRPFYVTIFVMGTLGGLAANPINSWSVLYAKQLNLGMYNWSSTGVGFGEYRLGYGGILTLTYVFSLCLAFPIGVLVDKFHPLRVSMVAMLLYGLSCLIGYAMIDGAQPFGWALLAHGVLSGSYMTASAAIGQMLMPRLRYSQFASAGGLLNSVVNMLYGPTLGAVLDWTGSNYRLTFLFSGILSVAALAMLVVVYKRFMALGGPGEYVSPLDAEAQLEASPRCFEVVTRSH